MIRLVMALLVTILVVAFFVMNLHFVTLSLVVGPPVQIRLIFLLVTAFGIGVVSAAALKLVTRQMQARRAASSGATRMKNHSPIDSPGVDR